MLLVKSVYDLSEIVSEINKDDPYRAKMGFNRVFRWKCFRTQLPRVKFETCESLQVSSTPCSVIDSLAAPKCFLQECAASTLGKRSKGSAPG